MSGRLVLYFSVYGTAKRVAEEIAFQTGADLLALMAKTEAITSILPAAPNGSMISSFDL